jgi:hypothetical protein
MLHPRRVAIRGSDNWLVREFGSREAIRRNSAQRAEPPPPRKANCLETLGRSSGLGFNLGPAFPLAQWLVWVLVILYSCGAAPDFNRLPVHRVREC